MSKNKSYQEMPILPDIVMTRNVEAATDYSKEVDEIQKTVTLTFQYQHKNHRLEIIKLLESEEFSNHEIIGYTIQSNDDTLGLVLQKQEDLHDTTDLYTLESLDLKKQSQKKYKALFEKFKTQGIIVRGEKSGECSKKFTDHVLQILKKDRSTN